MQGGNQKTVARLFGLFLKRILKPSLKREKFSPDKLNLMRTILDLTGLDGKEIDGQKNTGPLSLSEMEKSYVQLYQIASKKVFCLSSNIKI